MGIFYHRSLLVFSAYYMFIYFDTDVIIVIIIFNIIIIYLFYVPVDVFIYLFFKPFKILFRIYILQSSYGQGMRASSPEPAKHNISKSPDLTCSGIETVSETLGNGNSSDKELKRKTFEADELFKKDWRTFHCKTWHLEPTVR